MKTADAVRVDDDAFSAERAFDVALDLRSVAVLLHLVGDLLFLDVEVEGRRGRG